MDTELLIIDDESEIIIEVDTDVEVLEAAAQGPRGPQGIPGPAGGATTVAVGATPISGHCAVALDAGGLLVYADCTNPAHIGAVQGVVGNAYSPGDLVVVQTDFELVHAGWSFTAGPVLAGLSGALVQTLPPGALFAQVVSFALAPTRIRVDVQPPIVLT